MTKRHDPRHKRREAAVGSSLRSVERLAGGKASKRNAAHRRFRATGNHHIRIAESNEAGGIATSVRAGCTGRDDRVVRPAQLVLDRHMAGGQIDETARNEEGRNTARAPSRSV